MKTHADIRTPALRAAPDEIVSTALRQSDWRHLLEAIHAVNPLPQNRKVTRGKF